MRRLRFSLAAAILLLLSAAAQAAIPVYGYRIVHAYPHDPGAFTEGLFYRGGYLYESTGMEGRSGIRKVVLQTGKVVQERDLPGQYFGEGIVASRGRLIELTWRSEIGFIYDLTSFKPLGSFRYVGEGWALTTDGARLIMSDGTPTLRFLDPATLKETGRLTVTADGAPLADINELEWVRGEIWANVWKTDEIARIDPKTGQVVGWIDLSGLPSGAASGDRDAVLNGIAYDAEHGRLFVTGKEWSRLYQIELVQRRD